MASEVTLEQIGSVARYLSWMQRIFLGILVLVGCMIVVTVNFVSPPGFLVLLGMLVGMAASLMLLVCTYRCASGSGRSGILWILVVLIFKWIGLIILSYLTRKWLVSQGVKVKNFGLSFELPEEPVQALESPGFSRF